MNYDVARWVSSIVLTRHPGKCFMTATMWHTCERLQVEFEDACEEAHDDAVVQLVEAVKRRVAAEYFSVDDDVEYCRWEGPTCTFERGRVTSKNDRYVFFNGMACHPWQLRKFSATNLPEEF